MQRGFVEGRSTITQPLDTVHRITRAIHQGCHTDVAFFRLYFSNAFDLISHALISDWQIGSIWNKTSPTY